MYDQDKFSPYLDPDPIADFLEDVGGRGIITSLLALLVHVLFFFILQTRLDIPHVPDEPEPIVVEIISFEPEVEPEPKPKIEPEQRAAVPPPAQAPVPKPKPKPKPTPPAPKPEPEPIPEPELKPEPEPEPEPVVTPPTPKIITTPEPEPELETPPEPETQPETLPEPALDLFDPELMAQTEPELTPEPILDIAEPVTQAAEPIAPLFEADILEADLEPENLPEIDERLELAPAPVVTEEPLSGVETPKPEPAPELPPPPAPLFQQDIIETPPAQIEAQIETEIFETPDIEIAALPPTILASPDAPITQAESDNSIPEEQASTPLDFILKERGEPGVPGGDPANPSTPLGGNTDGAPVFTGSTPRAAPGAGGWQVGGTWPTDGLPGGRGIIRDIDCRGEKRDHEDCPEYVRGNTGRGADGFEAFGPHTPLGTSTIPPSRSIPTINNTFPTFGEPGSPSGSVLQDANGFNGQFLSDDVGPRDQGRRIRDVFAAPDAAPWTIQPDLPPQPEEDEDEVDQLIILKKPK